MLFDPPKQYYFITNLSLLGNNFDKILYMQPVKELFITFHNSTICVEFIQESHHIKLERIPKLFYESKRNSIRTWTFETIAVPNSSFDILLRKRRNQTNYINKNDKSKTFVPHAKAPVQKWVHSTHKYV